MDYHVSFVGGDVVIVGGKVDFDSDYDTIYIYVAIFHTVLDTWKQRAIYIELGKKQKKQNIYKKTKQNKIYVYIYIKMKADFISI